uniref:sulfite oxidase heme-binding subunit YedZ n=1 Tax=Cellvibrio fontiphilus TaxID=1815559 RepID=UPI002B4BC7C2|nr:protein-methionine-sulfoxide reductase heme-binding subunit MsrQ [Cellvibrio fontiphilus]
MPVVWRRVVIFFCSLIPLAFIVYQTLSQQLGADPASTIVLFTGEWALYFLFITLAVTPLRRLIKFRYLQFRWLQAHRRMLGLFTLFYALLHVTAFLVFILGLDVSRFAKELIERPYILVTLPAIVLLIALGITSTQNMMRRMGANWIRLHQSIYVIAILGWIHVLMQVRSSYFEATVLGVVLMLILSPRIYWALQRK